MNNSYFAFADEKIKELELKVSQLVLQIDELRAGAMQIEDRLDTLEKQKMINREHYEELRKQLRDDILGGHEIDDYIKKSLLDNYDHSDIAKHVDINDLADNLDKDEIAGCFDIEEIASALVRYHIEASDVASEIDLNSLAEEISLCDLAGYLDESTIASGIKVDYKLLAETLLHQVYQKGKEDGMAKE